MYFSQDMLSPYSRDDGFYNSASEHGCSRVFFAFPSGVYRRCSFSPCLFADGLLGGNFPQREFIAHKMKFYYRAYRSQGVKSPKTLKSGCQASRLFPARMSQVSQGQRILGSRGVFLLKKNKVLLARRGDVHILDSRKCSLSILHSVEGH